MHNLANHLFQRGDVLKLNIICLENYCGGSFDSYNNCPSNNLINPKNLISFCELKHMHFAGANWGPRFCILVCLVNYCGGSINNSFSLWTVITIVQESI